MGWPPAVIIVVRHGARLDAADKQWHLTSPIPYDPPLTYGGWQQSRAVGAKIASLLRSREEAEDSSLSEEQAAFLGEGLFNRRKKHKVVIHSSPFTRCIQTSIAIASGLGQNPPPRSPENAPAPRRMSLAPGDASRLYQQGRKHSIPSLSIGPPVVGLPGTPSGGANEDPMSQIPKTMLRVDAFLGEWLTPDYYEMITPPPNSIMMVASAKADLLRREEYNNLAEFRNGAHGSPIQGFPGGWGSPMTAPVTDAGARMVYSGLNTTPDLGRTNSPTVNAPKGSPKQSQGSLRSQTSYQPPIPSYAISMSDPIPAGYVAHARDACVDIDYQWDSMREPHNWGDGGQYGEEWSRMHHRFRKGLNSMLHWYRDHDSPAKPATRRPSTVDLGIGLNYPDEQDDGNTDLVLVLVTHGAGCNALIGALTNQPVLLDVGMASLTMAVRKPNIRRPSVIGPCDSPTLHAHFSTSSFDPSDEYDVQIVASKDHLKPGSSSGNNSRPSSGGTATTSIWRRPNFASRAGADVDGVRPHSISTASGYAPVRRATGASGHFAPVRKNSTGLWSSPRTAPQEDEETSPGDYMAYNFGDGGAGLTSTSTTSVTSPVSSNTTPTLGTAGTTRARDTETGAVTTPTTSTATGTATAAGSGADAGPATVAAAKEKLQDEEMEIVTPLGLWGSPNPFSFSEKTRDTAPKRRWTMNEQTSPTMAP